MPILNTIARLLLGFIYFINGANWVIKLLPYPAMHDPRMPQTPPFVQALLDTGFMFGLVRAVELIAGVALLANLWVPLTLVALFPITVIIWLVDVFLLTGSVRAQVMGWSVIMLNSALLLSHIELYRPMLTKRMSVYPWDRAGTTSSLGHLGVMVAACIAGASAAVWLCFLVYIQLFQK